MIPSRSAPITSYNRNFSFADAFRTSNDYYKCDCFMTSYNRNVMAHRFGEFGTDCFGTVQLRLCSEFGPDCFDTVQLRLCRCLSASTPTTLVSAAPIPSAASAFGVAETTYFSFASRVAENQRSHTRNGRFGVSIGDTISAC